MTEISPDFFSEDPDFQHPLLSHVNIKKFTNDYHKPGNDLIKEIENYTDTKDVSKHKQKLFVHQIEKSLRVNKLVTSVNTTQELVYDSLDQHKYAKLAQASYENFEGRDVEKYLSSAENNYIKELKEFKVDKKLSTIDDLVLHNKTTGETVMSFRGTAQASDWKTNMKIAFGKDGGQMSKRYSNAEALASKVIDKYGKKNLKVTGHSQGGGVSTFIAQKLDVEGHHFQPAMSFKQVQQIKNGEHTIETSVQKVYRTHFDPVSTNSLWGHVREKFPVTHVNTTKQLGEDLVGIHSLDNFHPKIEGISNAGLAVERNTTLSSLKTGAKAFSKVAGGVMTAQSIALDIKEDLKSDREPEQKVNNIALDLSKTAVEVVAGDALFGSIVGLGTTTVATGGLGLLAVASVAGLTFGIEHVVNEVKGTRYHSKLELIANGKDNLNAPDISGDIDDSEGGFYRNNIHYEVAKDFTEPSTNPFGVNPWPIGSEERKEFRRKQIAWEEVNRK